MGSREKITVIQANADSKKEIKKNRRKKRKTEKKIKYQTLMEIMLVTVRKGTRRQSFG